MDNLIGVEDSLIGAVDNLISVVDNLIGVVNSLIGVVNNSIIVVISLIGAVDSLIGAVDSLIGDVDSLIGAVDSLVVGSFIDALKVLNGYIMDWQTISLRLVLLILCVYSRDSAISQYIPDEQRLYDQIMTGYINTVRPVVNATLPLEVLFSIRLNQIVNLNERQQVLTVNVFIDQSWTDHALSWNPADFQDVRSLRIPADQVWKPDTFIYNNADNRSTGFIHGTYIQIKHTGEVNWPVPVRLRSSCVVKITYFPFDYQFCMLRFGSWIYSQKLVDYNVKQSVVNVDMSTYIKNSEWDLLSMKLEKIITNRSRGLGIHPHITAMLFLKRNTFYYLFNIIVPCMMLSMLTLMTFWLSPTSGEKVTLGLSVFLAFSMFMLLIAEEVPASSDAVPLIGIYLCVVMTMTSISVLCAVLVTNLHNRGSKLRPAPRWLASLFIRYLAQPFRVSQDVQLLASTIFLSDYCKYFILHDSRTVNKDRNNYSEEEFYTDPSSEDTSTHDIVSEEEDEEDKYESLFLKLPKTMLSGPYQKVSVYEEEVHSLDCGSNGDQQETNVDDIRHTPELSYSGQPLKAHSDNSILTPLLSCNSFHESAFKNHNIFSDTKALNQIGKTVPHCQSDNTFCECQNLEDVWVMRDDFVPESEGSPSDTCHCLQKGDSNIDQLEKLLSGKKSTSPDTSSTNATKSHSGTHQRQRLSHLKHKRSWPTHENPKLVLRRAKIMIAEWCTIAKVVDRCLFLFSLIATVFAYVFLLLVMPAGQNVKLDNATFSDSVNSDMYT
ncbi:Neuronal acetylcholine receptor subunit beta-3 [Bulinus truncatus]|nr:Neuronal acetylcholine receptor subunit beta-3 [Bulinus truncatus]